MTTEEKWERVKELQEEARMECEASYDHEARAAACRAEAARISGDEAGGEFYDAVSRMYRERFSPEATAAYDAVKAKRASEATTH